jgi:hypothetical protein
MLPSNLKMNELYQIISAKCDSEFTYMLFIWIHPSDSKQTMLQWIIF